MQFNYLHKIPAVKLSWIDNVAEVSQNASLYDQLRQVYTQFNYLHKIPAVKLSWIDNVAEVSQNASLYDP